MLRVNDIYSVLKGQNNPLSCDNAIIDGLNNTYIFEAGNSVKNVEEINNIKKDKVLIISHFHQDHLALFNDINYKKLYIGEHTYKYTNDGDIVDDLDIDDGVHIHLFKIPCSHSKGSIGLIVGDYCFIGDSLAPAYKNKQYVYNVQILKEEIDNLNKVNVKYFVSSHSMEKLMPKEKIIEELKNIYSLKEKNNSYIIFNDELYLDR